jgi:hypothetical protein
MIYVAKLTGWLRSLAIRPRSRRYTAEDVRRYISPESTALAARPDDAERIRRVIESLPLIIAEQQVWRKYSAFARYIECLPRIVFLYSIGHTTGEIAASMNFMATDYGVAKVIDIAAELIAARLNTA